MGGHMSNSFIDLHIHTTASDGSFTSVEVADLAKKANLKAIAITDHDSIDGLIELNKNYDSNELEVIPGIELSVDFETEMHLLGYFIDINSNQLIQDIKKIKSKRFAEVRGFFSNLKSFDISISPEDVIKSSGNLGKHSIAFYLVDKGYAKNINDAYEMFIHNSKLQKVNTLSPYEGIDIIKKAGGLCFLAHPNSLQKSKEELYKIIGELAAYGLNGIECYHSQCSLKNQKIYLKIAESHNLLISGGSDFHGKLKPEIRLGYGYGNLGIPYTILEKMKNY
jgi:predicted metal-dependent phosphoesterase TrpH